VLRWQGQQWELIDRGSRNGTRLNGVKLLASQAYAVRQGATLSFGDPRESWLLSDASEPTTMVVALDTGEILLGTAGVIGVPSSTSAGTSLYLDIDGRWKLEAPDADAVSIADGHIFTSRGRLFRFCCPTASGSTAAASGNPVDSVLHFSVSRDEEFVSLRMEHSHGHVELGSRSHNYLLLLLARSYLVDVAAGLAAEACGWVDKEQLATSLKMTDQQVDGEVHRIRKHFGQHGLPHAATIIDRRARTRQLRIGIAGLRIHTL
jgi:hypothetical protein